MNNNPLIKQFTKYIQTNKVKDLINEETKILLVCESPHTEELEMGLPLVGRAGKFVSKHLGVTENIGFGKYLSSQKSPTIGIMNVCPAPLQKTASKKQSNYDLSKTDFIRKNSDRLFCHKDSNINEMEKIIVDNFKNRLNQLTTKNKLIKIVICGNFAKHYFCIVAQTVGQLPPVAYLPHPAYNQWSRLTSKQKCILEELKNEI